MNAVAPTRSTFVTVVAWIFLMLSGFGLLISLLQNLMVHLLIPPEIYADLSRMPPEPGMPPMVWFMMVHMKWLFALVLVPVLAMFVASLGLLKRREWGRLLFIALMAFSIVMNLASLVFQGYLMVGMHEEFAAMAQQAPDGHAAPDLGMFFIGAGVVALLYALGLSAVQAWLIKRLVSPAVVAEFRAAATQA